MSMCSHYSKDTAYFINIDAYVPGQMSKELDPARISRLCHGTMEPLYLTTVFISRHDGEQTRYRKICITAIEISRSIFNNYE